MQEDPVRALALKESNTNTVSPISSLLNPSKHECLENLKAASSKCGAHSLVQISSFQTDTAWNQLPCCLQHFLDLAQHNVGACSLLHYSDSRDVSSEFPFLVILLSAACGLSTPDLLRCSRCKASWYCSLKCHACE